MSGKFGKKPARPLPQIARLSDRLTTTLPTPPTTRWEYGLTLDYPMAMNDQYGCCTLAAVVHLAQVWNNILGWSYTYPGDDAVMAAYAQLLGCTVEQLTSDPGQYDQGLDLATVITAWSSPAGLLGSRIVGAATIDIKDWVPVLQASYLFGGVYAGAQVPQDVIQQFDTGTYLHLDGPPEPPADGHCFILDGFQEINTSVGMRQGTGWISWAKFFACTANWWKTYADEVWVPIPQVFVEAGHDAIGVVDIAALEGDIAALHAA